MTPDTPTPSAARELLRQIESALLCDDHRAAELRTRAMVACRPFIAAYAEQGERRRLAEAECDAAREVDVAEVERMRVVHSGESSGMSKYTHPIISRMNKAAYLLREARAARDAASVPEIPDNSVVRVRVRNVGQVPPWNGPLLGDDDVAGAKGVEGG